MSNQDTYTLLAHGSRNIKESIIPRYKLTNENAFYVVYTQYGLTLRKTMTPLIKMVLKNKNNELKTYFKEQKNFTKNDKVIPFHTMEFYVIQLFNIVIDDLEKESRNDIRFTYKDKKKNINYDITKYKEYTFNKLYNNMSEDDFLFIEFVKHILNISTLDKKMFDNKKDRDNKHIITYVLFLFKFADIFYYVLKKNDYHTFNKTYEQELTKSGKTKHKTHKTIKEYFIYLLNHIKENIDTLLNINYNNLGYIKNLCLGNDKINIYLDKGKIYTYEKEQLLKYQKLYTDKDGNISLPFHGTERQYLEFSDSNIVYNNLSVLHVIILSSHINVKVYNTKFIKKTIPNINISIIKDFLNISSIKSYITKMNDIYSLDNSNISSISIKDNHNIITKKILQKPENFNYVEYKTGIYSINDDNYFKKMNFFAPKKEDINNENIFETTSDTCFNDNKFNIWCLAYFIFLKSINKLEGEELSLFSQLFFYSNSKNDNIDEKINNINNDIYNTKTLDNIITYFEKHIKPSKPTFLHVVCCTAFKSKSDNKVNKYQVNTGYSTNNGNVKSLSFSNHTKHTIPTIIITNNNNNKSYDKVNLNSKHGGSKYINKIYKINTRKQTKINNKYKTRKLIKH